MTWVQPVSGGGSLVAQYRTDSDKYLGVTARLGNATAGQSKSFTLTVPARGVTEHGWADAGRRRSSGLAAQDASAARSRNGGFGVPPGGSRD